MKRCPTSLVMREMLIKTTVRYHLIPNTMVIIKKSTNKNAGEDVEKKEILLHCLWECKLIQT